MIGAARNFAKVISFAKVTAASILHRNVETPRSQLEPQIARGRPSWQHDRRPGVPVQPPARPRHGLPLSSNGAFKLLRSTRCCSMEEPAPATTEAAAPAVEMPAETSASDESDSASPLVLEQGTPLSATVDVTDDQLIIRLQKNSDAVDAMRKDSPAVRTDAEEVATRAPAKEPEDTTAEDKGGGVCPAV